MKGIKWMLLVFSIMLVLGSVNGIPDNDKSLGFVGALSWFGVLFGMFLLGMAFTLLIVQKEVEIKTEKKDAHDSIASV